MPPGTPKSPARSLRSSLPAVAALMCALLLAAPAAARSYGPVPDPLPAVQEAPLDLVGAEYQLMFMINTLRHEHGVPPLEPDGVLIEIARERSTDMAERQYFSHDIPGVGFAPQWLLEQLPDATGTGENLGLSDTGNDAVLAALFDAWVASPSHLENMLRPEFTRVGVGVVEVPSARDDATLKIITQVFAIASGPLARR